MRGERIVQAALDKVSQGRTTITIAHRLSTIIKADSIVVLKGGQAVQQGTHEQLMADTEGPYWALANAQRLSLGADSTASSSSRENGERELDEEVFQEISMDTAEFRNPEGPLSKSQGYFGSFGLFLCEQRMQWRWYSVMLLGSLGAGGNFLSLFCPEK